MSNEDTLISIGMSARNAGKTLLPALRSLIDQTHQRWELLLVDDGSTDDTAAIAEHLGDPRIRILRRDAPAGIAARLNEAVDEAAGEYFARMDADDVSFPERLERQLALMKDNPGLDLVGCAALVFRGDGTLIGRLGCHTTHEEICSRPWRFFNDLLHPAWFGRSEWFRRFRYAPEYSKARRYPGGAEDRELLLRAYRVSQFASISEPLIGYRQESLDLRKILTARWYGVCALAAGLGRGDLRLLPGIPEQMAMALLDMFAIGTGLQYRILRHRAQPISPAEAGRWRELWSRVNRPPSIA